MRTVPRLIGMTVERAVTSTHNAETACADGQTARDGAIFRVAPAAAIVLATGISHRAPATATVLEVGTPRAGAITRVAPIAWEEAGITRVGAPARTALEAGISHAAALAVPVHSVVMRGATADRPRALRAVAVLRAWDPAEGVEAEDAAGEQTMAAMSY